MDGCAHSHQSFCPAVQNVKGKRGERKGGERRERGREKRGGREREVRKKGEGREER